MYQLNHNADTILRLADGACIPVDPLNRDYREYLADVAADPTCVQPADAPVVPVRQIAKSLVLSRLTDLQLDNALALMNNRQKERWRAPDHPLINVDDPELLAVLHAVGADATLVLAVP